MKRNRKDGEMSAGKERIFEIEKIVSWRTLRLERSSRKDKIGHNYRNERRIWVPMERKEDNRRSKVKIREKKMEAN